MTPAAARSTTGLLERERELRALEEALASARAGTGGVVAVRGAAGLGKTALLEAAARAAPRRGFTVLRARGAELERELPFGAVLQLFERHLAELDGAARADALRGAARLAAPLFGGVAAGEDGASRREGVHWLAANLAERAPLALLVDDAHWLDRPSLAALHYLAQRVADLPVVLVVAFRPREPGTERELLAALGDEAAVVVEPAPLSGAATRDVVRARFAEADAGFCDACATAAGGNPFLLRELLATIAARAVEPVEESREAVAALAPETVGRTVLARLARLSPDAAAVARATAVLGRDATLRRVATLAALGIERAGAAADELAGADVLAAGWPAVLVPDAGSEPLAFVHPLLGTAVHEDVAPAERAGLHRAAARMLADEGLAAERVAAHLLATRAAEDPWVVDTLCAAAAQATAAGAPATAAAQLRRALAEPPRAGRRAAVVLALADAEARAGRPAEAAAAYRKALAADPAPEVAAALARVLAAAGRAEEAGRVLDAALAALGGGADDRDAATMLQAAWVAVSRSSVAMRAQAAARIDAVVTREGGPRTQAERVAMALVASERVFAGEPRGEAVRLARLAYDGGRLLAEETSEGVAWVLAVSALGWADELGEYERGFEAGLADARRRGSVLAFATCCYGLNFGRYYTGRLAEAVADARQALDARRHGWVEYAPACAAQLAWALVERGELDEAEAALAVADAIPGAADLPGYGLALDARGRVLLARGDAAGALDRFLEAGRLMDAASLPNPAIAPWAGHAAIAAARLGQRDRARELAASELAAARAFGAPRAIGMALRASGLVAGGDGAASDTHPRGTASGAHPRGTASGTHPRGTAGGAHPRGTAGGAHPRGAAPGADATAGIELLREAVAVLAGSPAALEHARALTDLGAALRRAGHDVDAREPLRAALDRAHRFGAFALEARAREELIAAGGRPRRHAATGRDALTPGELRVAAMAARGMTNRKIAEDLFVTVKAVQWHLRGAYRKLGFSDRTLLAAALAPPEG